MPATDLSNHGNKGSHAKIAPAASTLEQTFAAAQRGNKQALDLLLRGLGPKVLAAARGLLGPAYSALAEDVAQDSLIRIARDIGRVRDERCLEAYTVKTTIRVALRARRKAQRFVSSTSIPQATKPDAVELETHRRRQADALLALLDELPEAQAQALFFQVALGQSLEEVSRTLDIPANTVRSRVRLGREAIKKKLAKRPQLRALLES